MAKSPLADVSDRAKLAHDAARDTVKHLITLSTAAVGILIAIFKDLLGSPTSVPMLLWLSILFFGLSSLCGLFSLQSLTGNLEKKDQPTIYDPNVKVFVTLQILIFVAAVVSAGFSVTFG